MELLLIAISIIVLILCVVKPIVSAKKLYKSLSEEEKRKFDEARKSIIGLKIGMNVVKVTGILSLIILVTMTVLFIISEVKYNDSSLISMGSNSLYAMTTLENLQSLNDNSVVDYTSYYEFGELVSIAEVFDIFAFILVFISYSVSVNIIKKETTIDQRTRELLLKYYGGNKIRIIVMALYMYAMFYSYRILTYVS